MRSCVCEYFHLFINTELRESKLFQSVHVASSNSRTSRRQCCWSYIARQCTVTERIYRPLLPRREREWIEVEKSLNRGRQAVFLTTVNPMEDGSCLGETPCDLTKPKIAPYKNTWKRFQNTVFWCNSNLAQEKDLQFHQTRSHAVVLYNTLPAACVEKAVCVKTQDELCQRVPRVVLKSNSQCGAQDPQSQEARSSWEPSTDSKSYGETCNNTVDYRTSGVPLSAVEQQDTTQGQEVSWSRSSRTTNISNHSFRIWARRRRSTSSAKNRRTWSPTWTTPRPRTFRNSSKHQCPDCNTYWEKVYSLAAVEEIWSLREVQQSSTRTTVTSPQSLEMWARRTAVVRTLWTTKNVLPSETDVKKKRQEKQGCHPTILSRWYASESYRNSLYDIRWREKHNVVRQNRRGEADLHRYKIWENSKFEALDSHDKCRRTSATTQSTARLCSSEKRMQTIAWRALGKDPRRIQSHSSQSTNKTAKRTLKQVGGSTNSRGEICRQIRQDRRPTCKQLRHRRQIGPNTLEDEQLEFSAFFKPWQWWNCFLRVGTGFGCLEKKPPANRRGVWIVHPQIQHVQSCTAWSHFITRTRVALKLKDCTSLCPQNNCHPRVMSHCFAAPDTDHQHKFSLTHFIHFTYLSDSLTCTHASPVALDPYFPCDVPRQSGGSAHVPSLTGYEPKLVEFKAIETEAIELEDLEPRRNWTWRESWDGSVSNTGKSNEKQVPKSYHRRHGWMWQKVGAEMSYIQPQMHSDYDSAESIADSDLEDGERRKMLASPLYMQIREDCESFRMPIAPEKLAAMFSSGSEEPGNQFKSSVFKHADPSNLGRFILEAQIMVQYGRPSLSSWAKSVWSSFGRTFMGKAIGENPIEIQLGEGFHLGLLVRTPWKRVVLICVCGWHKIGWKETKHWSNVESTQQISRFGRTNIFPWSCILGMHSKTMWNK